MDKPGRVWVPSRGTLTLYAAVDLVEALVALATLGGYCPGWGFTVRAWSYRRQLDRTIEGGREHGR